MILFGLGAVLAGYVGIMRKGYMDYLAYGSSACFGASFTQLAIDLHKVDPNASLADSIAILLAAAVTAVFFVIAIIGFLRGKL